MAYLAGVKISVNGGPEQTDLDDVTLHIGDKVEITGRAYKTNIVSWEAKGLLSGSGTAPVTDNHFKITDTVSSRWKVRECSNQIHYKLWPGEVGAKNFVNIEGQICPPQEIPWKLVAGATVVGVALGVAVGKIS